jgi:hypothetical protein
MRGLFAAALSVLVGTAGVVAAGCVIFTGSTDGYRPVDAGGEGGEGGPGLSLACVSSADCGDGGQVCCVVLSGSLTTANTTCQAGPCGGILPAQLCKTSTECGKAGLCTTQSCNFGTGSVTIEACGTVNGCTPQ